MKQPKELIPLADPKQDPAWMNSLDYLLEYFPEKAWDLYQSKKLEDYLDEKATQIVNREQELLNRMPLDQAKEQASEEFLPSDTDLPEQELLPSVWEDQQRIFLAAIDLLRNKNVRPELHRIRCPHRSWIRDLCWRRTDMIYLVDGYHITDFVIPEDIIDGLLKLVQAVV